MMFRVRVDTGWEMWDLADIWNWFGYPNYEARLAHHNDFMEENYPLPEDKKEEK